MNFPLCCKNFTILTLDQFPPCQVRGRSELNVDVTIGKDGQVAFLPLKPSTTTSNTSSTEPKKGSAREDSWLDFQEQSLHLKSRLLSFEEPLDLRTCLNFDNRDHLFSQLGS